MTPRTLSTFGHGTVGRDALTRLLHDAGILAVVDVRTGPGSRRDPDLARTRLAAWLPEAGIAYRWERDLGGFRKPPPARPTPSGATPPSAATRPHPNPEFVTRWTPCWTRPPVSPPR
ncbi:hypothetical protein GCM10023238_39500 [Streptomyces heliomycini]